MARAEPIHPAPDDTPSRRRLGAALALSILAHAGAAAVLSARPPAGDAALTPLELAREPDAPEEPPVPEDERLVLGSPESRVTSITWIGAAEREESAAPTGDVDQAAYILIANVLLNLDETMTRE